MENKYFNKEEIFQIIAKERILSLVISVAIAFSLIGGAYYVMNEFIMKQEKDRISNSIKEINTDKIYRGIINLEKMDELEVDREVAEGVKEGFDEYEASNQVIQASGTSNSSSSSLKPKLPNNDKGISSGGSGSSQTGQNTNDNLVSVDNSSITGRNARILEGQEFNPIKDLKLKATDTNGKDISNKIYIVENNVDIYVPGQYMVKAIVPLNNNSNKELVLTVNVEPTSLSVNVKKFESTSELINKGENILVNIDLYSSKEYVSALSININGIDYIANKIEAKSKVQKYTVELPGGNEPGNIDLNLSSIRMSDNTVIELDKKTKVTVAKERPIVSSFSYEETKGKDSSEALIKVRLEDKDSALVNGIAWLYIYDQNEKLVLSKPMSANNNVNIDYIAKENGIYKVKIVADFDLGNKLLNDEELFNETIEIKGVDKTNLTGENIKVKLGEEFEPIKDLKIKATDIDGRDITEKVVIEENTVDINVPGKYIVKALVINKNGEELRKEFTVEVINSIVKRILELNSVNTRSDDIEVSSFKGTNTEYSNQRSTSTTVSGNDSQILKSDLIITGNVLNGNGGTPAGRIEVELPTKTVFSVDKDGKFIGTNFNVVNKGGCDIDLSVAQFIEGNPKGGITIDNNIIDFANVGRATIRLQLQATANGVTSEVYLDRTISNRDLVTVGAGDTAVIHLLGKAGVGASIEEDTNGVAEDFIVRFKIQKKKII